MVTMQQIADEVGVHRVTVSNVLNNRLKSQRSDAARRAAEIRRLATEYGYRFNAAARATRSGTTHSVGMLLSESVSYSVHEPNFERAVVEALHQRGLCLVKDLIDSPAGHDGELPRLVRESMVDGLLVNYVFGTPPAVRDMLERSRTPTIWINRKRLENCVRPDDEGAAYEAASQMIRAGHTALVWVTNAARTEAGSEPNHYSLFDRQAGYERAMAEAGLTSHIATMTGGFGQANSYNQMLEFYLQLLGGPDRPKALLCQDGPRIALAAAWKLGLRVPEDLSIMGFENQEGANKFMAVDRLVVPFRSMGHAAVEQLQAVIAEPDQSRKPVVLPMCFERVGTVAQRA